MPANWRSCRRTSSTPVIRQRLVTAWCSWTRPGHWSADGNQKVRVLRVHPIHRFVRWCGRELGRSPRPLAYNWDARLRPSIGATLAYLKMTIPDFFFIQVGAHDGKLADPIHRFVEQFQLRGLLLEPQPELFDALQLTYAHRPDLTLVNAAIAPVDGKITMHRVRPARAPEHWVTATASLRRDMLDTIRCQVADLDGMTETIRVQAITPKSLFRDYEVTRCDF